MKEQVEDKEEEEEEEEEEEVLPGILGREIIRIIDNDTTVNPGIANIAMTSWNTDNEPDLAMLSDELCDLDSCTRGYCRAKFPNSDYEVCAWVVFTACASEGFLEICG